MRAAGPLSLQSLALPVGEIPGASVRACRSRRNVSLACPGDFDVAPHCFHTGVGKCTSGSGLSSTAHPCCDQPREHSWLGAGSEGSSSITCDRKGLLGSFQEERRGLNPSCAWCSVFHGRLEAHPRTPTPVPTFQAQQQQQQPGTFLN